MLMQHIGVGYFGYYRATAYAMKHSLMPEIGKLRMKAVDSICQCNTPFNYLFRCFELQCLSRSVV